MHLTTRKQHRLRKILQISLYIAVVVLFAYYTLFSFPNSNTTNNAFPNASIPDKRRHKTKENLLPFEEKYYKASTECEELPKEGKLTAFSEGRPQEDWQGAGKDNTASVTAEEVARWKGTRLLPLPKVKRPETGVEELWNILAPWIMLTETYPDPMYVEFAAAFSSNRIGRLLSQNHPKSGTALLFKNKKAEANGDQGSQLHPASYDTFDRKNFLSVHLPADYEPLFRSCHLFNAAFLLQPGEDGWLGVQGFDLLPKVIQLSRVTFVEVGEADVEEFHTIVGKLDTSVEEVARGVKVGSVVFRLALRQLKRNCRKTWSAEEVQWGRSTELSYVAETETVSFKVVSKKAALGRSIHPMSYIPHFNLETLSSLGLTHAQRMTFLAQQLATPRYPDPMVHNWVWAGGGLQRIDKIDKRYEKDVNETATYWGTDSVGYLTLLSDNLCLPKLPSQFPSSIRRDCARSCGCCGTSCSYAPKCKPPSPHCEWGTKVCELCMECSRCLIKGRSAGVYTPLQANLQCPFNKYKTWSGATKVWSKWKKDTIKHKATELWFTESSLGCGAM